MCITFLKIGANMSAKRLLLRMTETDQRKLDVIADAMGGMSRSAAIRFLIRQWVGQKQNGHNDIQVASQPPRL